MGILKSLRTREDLEYLAGDLEELRSGIYKGKNGVSVPQIVKKDFEFALDKGQYLESLRREILSARILELIVSGYLEDAVLDGISKWVKENVGEDVVLSIKIDPSIMAGAKISFNGRFEDYSLTDKLEEAIKNISL